MWRPICLEANVSGPPSNASRRLAAAIVVAFSMLNAGDALADADYTDHPTQYRSILPPVTSSGCFLPLTTMRMLGVPKAQTDLWKRNGFILPFAELNESSAEDDLGPSGGGAHRAPSPSWPAPGARHSATCGHSRCARTRQARVGLVRGGTLLSRSATHSPTPLSAGSRYRARHGRRGATQSVRVD